MANVRQGCGGVDTAQSPAPWVLRDARRWPLLVALLLAALLHVPMVPSRLMLLLRLFLAGPAEETGPMQEEVVMPVDLDVDFMAEPGEQAPGAAGPAAGQAGELVPEPPAAGAADAGVDGAHENVEDDWDKEEAKRVRDAGAAPVDAGDAGGEPPDAAAGDAAAEPADAGGEPRAVAEVPPAPADGGVAGPLGQADAGGPGPRAPPPTVSDPYAVAGTGAASLGAEHPNVRIYLAADRIRKHRLGTMFSQLLQAIPQWAEVLGTTGIDPIRDFDHILLSGPQMRDPSYVVVTLDYNLSAAKMGETVRRVSAAAPGGRRLKDAPVPAWVIGQRGERIAALHPKRRLLVIVPRAAEDKLGAVKKMRGFERSTDRIIALYIVTPWRAFRGTGFRFPESVKWLRLVLLPTDEDDQFLLQVEAEDASADAAAKDALQLGADLELVRVIDLGDIPFFGKQVELIGRPEIQVHGNRIHATAPVSEAQLRRIMKVIIPRLEAQGERRRAGGKGGGKG